MRRDAPRGSTDGFVFAEALVALVLISLTLGLLFTALGFARRVSTVGAEHTRLVATAAGVHALSGWFSGVTPAHTIGISGLSPARFRGRPDEVTFVTLSHGDVLPGGLLAMTVGARSGSVVFEAGTLPLGQDAPTGRGEQDVLLDQVTFARFRYFGSIPRSAPPQWHSEWQDLDHLPQIVALQVRLPTRRGPEVMEFAFRLPES